MSDGEDDSGPIFIRNFFLVSAHHPVLDRPLIFFLDAAPPDQSFEFRNGGVHVISFTQFGAIAEGENNSRSAADGSECLRRRGTPWNACRPTATTQDCTVFLACEDNSDAEAEFLFQRKDRINGDFADLLPVSGVDQCSYSDILTGDVGGIVYTWQAFAFGLDSTISEPSNEATFTTPSISGSDPPPI
jgi:hypothetical protein